jgi:hypothetical protein
MITCMNQGVHGPTFSKLTADALADGKVNFLIRGCDSSSVSVILDKKNVAILGKKLLDWAGEKPECVQAVTGIL